MICTNTEDTISTEFKQEVRDKEALVCFDAVLKDTTMEYNIIFTDTKSSFEDEYEYSTNM